MQCNELVNLVALRDNTSFQNNKMNSNHANDSPTHNQLANSNFDYYFDLQAWTLPTLKSLAIHQSLSRPRSLAWAILLKALPPPQEEILFSLRTHRNFYEDLKKKLSMDPRAVVGDDPLSQNDESAWNQHFCDNELKVLILQDVVRTFPDEYYFRDKDVQDLMVRVLFFWARSHPSIGYRQGMHEILAPLLFELFLDRKYAPKEMPEILIEVLRVEYLEHDSYMLFSTVIKGIERFYTTGDIVPTSCGRMPSSKLVHNPNEVVRYLDRIREEHLVPLDKELATHLANCNISLELFGIRWLRLLFGREFPRSELPHLWGFLFAEGPTLPHVHHILLAMLLSMRHTLLAPEPGAVLSALMRPGGASAGHVIALALHLSEPLFHPRPPTPPQPQRKDSELDIWSLEESGVTNTEHSDMDSEGVEEGDDVARSLATLALLRAQLPPAAAALAAALPRPCSDIAEPLQRILQLASLLQCRNHALIDVETALEAAEGQTTEKVGKRQLVPVALIGGKHAAKTAPKKVRAAVKEVPLKVFQQTEGVRSDGDFPCMDPLRLRTD